MANVTANQSEISPASVDREKGIVYGCRLAEAGALATFSDLDGKRKQIRITSKVIAGLLALFSAQGQTTSHWTHGWIERGEDGLASKVATFKSFRIDDAGNLLADAHLWPTDKKEAILHAAENDPRGMMISTVFNYKGDTETAEPTSVLAADFVEKGASTTALLAKLSSNQIEKQTMDKSELKTAILALIAEDAEIKAAVLSCVPEPKAEDAAKMEDACGVTDADKKDGDESMPAIMRAYTRSSRALARQKAEISAEKEAILAAAETRAASAATALLGKGAIVQKTDSAKDEVESAINEQIAAGAKDRGIAILALAKNKPELYNRFRNEGKI